MNASQAYAKVVAEIKIKGTGKATVDASGAAQGIAKVGTLSCAGCARSMLLSLPCTVHTCIRCMIWSSLMVHVPVACIAYVWLRITHIVPIPCKCSQSTAMSRNNVE